MQKKFLTYSIIAGVLLILFCALTVSLTFVDVREAGESGATVGFATINEAVFDALGQNAICLKLSGLCGKLIIAAVVAFGVTGLVQIIRRKGILRADKELYAMVGGFALFGAAYLLFEVVVINCRPVLEDGELAASYPSTHAMMATVVAGMGAVYLLKYLKTKFWHGLLCGLLVGIACVTVTLRLFSGVHWLTDIAGGVLLGGIIVALYGAACALWGKKQEQGNEG